MGAASRIFKKIGDAIDGFKPKSVITTDLVKDVRLIPYTEDVPKFTDHHSCWQRIESMQVVEVASRKQSVCVDEQVIETEGELVIPADAENVIIGELNV